MAPAFRLSLLSFAIFSCTPSPPVQIVEPAVESRRPASIEDAPTRLRESRVQNDSPWRGVLWTWTSQEQHEALRAPGARLLIRTRSPQHGQSRFDEMMAEAQSQDLMAELLRRPRFAAKRFAWVNPWATLVGPAGESYGPSLIRVELRPEALVARFDPSRSPAWTAFRASGQSVDNSVVLNDPGRLAAVYHVSPASEARLLFREYVVVNEAMVTWSIREEHIRPELDRAMAVFDYMERYAPTGGSDEEWSRNVTMEWRDGREPNDLPALWRSTLAFADSEYHPDLERLSRQRRHLAVAFAALDGALVDDPHPEQRPLLDLVGTFGRPL